MSGKLLKELETFLEPFERPQYVPQQKFMRDVVTGILISKSPLLSEIARVAKRRPPDGRSRLFESIENRLSLNLRSDRFDDAAFRKAWWETVEKITMANDGADLTLGLDYTDASKPNARPKRPKGMQCATKCHDGSRNVRDIGYPIVQIDGNFEDRGFFPIVFEPFSFDEPGHKSQNATFRKYIEEAAAHVGSQAIWTADRGFDSQYMIDTLDGVDARFVIRLKTDTPRTARKLMLPDGTMSGCDDIAFQVIPNWKVTYTQGRGRKEKTRTIKFGARKVYLVSKWKSAGRHRLGPARMLIVAYLGDRKPMVLLASEYEQDREAALKRLFAYYQRWGCETSTRQLKDRRRWGPAMETFLVTSLRGIKRLVRMVSLVQLFLEFVRRKKQLAKKVIDAIEHFADEPKDLRYRLFRGAGRLLRRIRRGLMGRWCRGSPAARGSPAVR